jgi:hypothetical protein
MPQVEVVWLPEIPNKIISNLKQHHAVASCFAFVLRLHINGHFQNALEDHFAKYDNCDWCAVSCLHLVF